MATNANGQGAGQPMTYEQYMENLRSMVINDDIRRLVAEAPDEDKVILATSIIEEAIAYQDFQMARSVASDDLTSQIELLSVFFDRLDPAPDQASERRREAPIPAQRRSRSRELQQDTEASNEQASGSGASRDCTACQESAPASDLITAPCGHDYCKNCIRHLFTTALGDEELFPPRCCRQPIPVSSARPFLSDELRRAFDEKVVEFNTPNKTYCSRDSCSAFIPSSDTANEVAVCPRCRTRTCTMCKSKAHAGRDCPHDTGLRKVLDMADQEGLQRCFRCGRMTELVDGCNTVTYCSASVCRRMKCKG